MLIGQTRTRRQQWVWLGSTAAAAFALALFLFPFLVRILPFGLDGVIAATIMKAGRWNADASRMQAGDPDGWRKIQSAAEFKHANQGALDACRKAAQKTKKMQRCEFTVQPSN